MTDPASILLFYVCLFFEVNTEPVLAQKAAANVIMKRAEWDHKKLKKVILKPKHFSWTNDPVKLKEAKEIMRTGVLPKRMHDIRKKAYVWLSNPDKDSVWTHYQVHTLENPTWTCYRKGDTTVIFEGSNHVFCADKDVVKPGMKPKYIVDRLAKRSVMKIWMKNRARVLGDNFKNDC
jgi:hypothetical protein